MSSFAEVLSCSNYRTGYRCAIVKESLGGLVDQLHKMIEFYIHHLSLPGRWRIHYPTYPQW